MAPSSGRRSPLFSSVLRLKVKALRSFEMSVSVYQSTRCHVLEDWNLWQRRCENLKSRNLLVIHLVKKFGAVHGSQYFFVVFIHFATYPCLEPVEVYLYLALASLLFLSGFPFVILPVLIFCPQSSTVPVLLSLLE